MRTTIYFNDGSWARYPNTAPIIDVQEQMLALVRPDMIRVGKSIPFSTVSLVEFDVVTMPVVGTDPRD